MPAYHVLYQQSLGRILPLVHNGNADHPVDACPDWTVRDTIAHCLGVLTDLSAGKIDDASSDAWSAEHIRRAGGRNLSDLTAEWHQRANTSPGVFQELGAVLVADLVTHEFDIKQAIGNRQGRDLPVLRTVALFYLNALDHTWRAYGERPLQIITEDKRLDIGGDTSAATVEMSWWEITRVVSGRWNRCGHSHGASAPSRGWTICSYSDHERHPWTNNRLIQHLAVILVALVDRFVRRLQVFLLGHHGREGRDRIRIRP